MTPEIAKLATLYGALWHAVAVALEQCPDRQATIAALQNAAEKHADFLMGQPISDVDLEHAHNVFDSLISRLRSL